MIVSHNASIRHYINEHVFSTTAQAADEFEALRATASLMMLHKDPISDIATSLRGPNSGIILHNRCLAPVKCEACSV